MKHSIIFIFFFLNNAIIAQQFNALAVPVFENGQELANPWVGGFNAPQWSAVDLNHDGIQDLYVFDRQGNVHIGFVNVDNGTGKTVYKQTRYWLNHFPAGQNFVLMRDYNRDGAADMFVSAFDEGLSGFKVFKGSYNTNNQLVFDRVEFPEYTFDIIPFVSNGNVVGHVEVYNNPDYPAIDDIDGDGDLDILTMNSNGSKVFYFKNIALESGFNDEVLLYELADDCWGRFGLTVFSQKLTLSSDADMCAFFTDPDDHDNRVHGGTTLCTFDNDNDGDKEVLYGDFLYPTMIFATNGGDANTAYMTGQDTMFPSNDLPINIPNFVSSFHLDVNNDGASDLLFCPNIPDGTPDINTVWWYENEGTEEAPNFHFQQNDFIVEGMLDFGTGASPVFADVNADGLLDIVVGNRLQYESAIVEKSYLVLMLNTGTDTEPTFEVVDRDWLGMSQYNPDVRSLAPAFGDLDGDGDQDLLIGDNQGFVHYFENKADPGQPMSFPDISIEWQNINVGRYATPFIFDVNKDGLLDLLIGERAGNINYLPNIGTVNTPVFHPNESELPNNQSFGNIFTDVLGTAAGFSQPIALEFGDSNYLITGSEAGWLMRYKINPDSLEHGTFELLDGQFGGLREGAISRVALANINGNDFLDAVVGNDRGGVSIFQSPITIDGLVNNKELENVADEQFVIYPNPANNFIFIELKNNQPVNNIEYQIFNSIGQFITGGKGSNNNGINISSFPDGVYLIKVNANGKTAVKRFVKH